MKKFLLFILLSFLMSTSTFARSTGCKEGNCDNGYGKWVYTDKTTYEGEWANGFMNGQGIFTWADGKQKKGIWKNGKLQE